MPTIFLGLGSNIHPEKNLRDAAKLLRKQYPNITFASIYETAPQNLTDQPTFLNAVAQIETDESPDKIHEQLKKIEQTLNKDIQTRFGPRTIDLDILLYDNLIQPNAPEWLQTSKLSNYQTSKLLIPHPRMHERRFVLEPLLELIEKTKKHPVIQKTWQELLQSTQNQSCKRTELILDSGKWGI